MFLVLASCQKEIDLAATDPNIAGANDSTLLIKSITLVNYDINTGVAEGDSIIEHYSYDTVNRKVILSWENYSGDIPENLKEELSYNNQNLLSRIEYKYPAGYRPADNDYSAIEISYDAGNVLKKSVVNFANGSSEARTFNKKFLSSGNYQLEWLERPLTTGSDKTKRSAIFDSKGKNIIRVTEFSYPRVVTGTGNDIYTNIIITDSLSYDANGGLHKLFTNVIDTLSHTNENYISCEFISRLTKGGQLYNQRQALLNGIAAIPFGEVDDWFRYSFGILNFFPEGIEPLEYSRYPFITARVYDYNTRIYKEFTASSEIDSKGRLLKFKGFFNDSDLIPQEYKIAYFK